MSRLDKLKFPILLVFFVILFPSPGMGEVLYARNALPVFSSAAPPLIEEASLEDSVALEAGYSSTFIIEDSDRWSYRADMETLTLDLLFRKKITSEYELSLVIPFVNDSSGFLDSFLEAYHNFFDLPDYGRSRRPHNEFFLDVKREGEVLIIGKNGDPGPGDIRVSLKRRIISGNPLVSVKGFIELPTGNRFRGYGNGSLDIGALVLLDYEVVRDLMLHLNLGYTLPGEMDGIKMRGFLNGAVAFSYPLTKGLTGVVEVVAQESPLEKTGIAELDRGSVILTIGGLFDAGEKRVFETSLSEDLNTAGSPDFTLNLGLRFRF